MNGPHFDFNDESALDFHWAVPLDEPSPPAGVKASADDPAILPFTHLEADALPTEGFHPRLKRFDEAA